MIGRHIFQVLIVASITLLACQDDSGPGSLADHESVLLISLDGFVFDYMKATATPGMDSMALQGVLADALVPVFPSKTFPNHYSQVTGLYPENHGIISNRIFDSVFQEYFSLDALSVRDGRWYGGEPIWVTAKKQGLRTATMFWPGSDAEIAGYRPDEYFAFNGAVSNRARVQQVMDWLNAGSQRPHFISLYFELVDQKGHIFGPHSAEVSKAVAEIDLLLLELWNEINTQSLQHKVNIILVSDHGMTEVSRDKIIFLDDYIDLNQVEVVNWSPVLELIPLQGQESQIFGQLEAAHPQLSVYQKQDIPDIWHYGKHYRVTPIVALANSGWSISSRSFFESNPNAFTGGTHGYHPDVAAMRGIFLATGPGFASGVTIDAVENIHLYELMCHLLDLTPAPNNGLLSTWDQALR